MNSIECALQRHLAKACATPPQPSPILKTRRFASPFSGNSPTCLKEFRIALHFLPCSGLLVLGMLLSAIVAAAQPPPLGPPKNSTEEGTFGVFTITRFVRATAQKSVDLSNAQLKADGKAHRVSVDSISTIGGHRSQTTAINKPNSWCVVVPFSVKLKVAISGGFDRRIFIPVDVKFFCDGWHEERGGTVVARSEPGPASFEGGSDFELFGLRQFIDGQVRRGFTAPGQSVISLGLRCSTIGYSNKGTASVLDDDVVWDLPKRIRVERTDSMKPRILVTFENLRRLRARKPQGNTILYKEVEEITFRGFVNYSEVGKSFLSMREGEEVALRLRTLAVNPQVFDKLVVIGSIEQPPDNPKDSSFITAARSLNYRPGRHRLQIPKWYSEINQHTNKPIFSSIPAYELTYFVRFTDPIRHLTQGSQRARQSKAISAID